jgi:hypothetical protein
VFCCVKVIVDCEIEKRDGGHFQLLNFAFKANGRSESKIEESTSCYALLWL